MTPFEAVGFPFATDEDYDGLVPMTITKMMKEARRLPCPAGAEGWSYRDPSGAGLLAFGLVPTGTSAAELARVQEADSTLWAPAVKASGFTPEQ